MPGWLLYPRAAETLCEHPLNQVPCCLHCRTSRGTLHVGAWLADCLNGSGMTPQTDEIIRRLNGLEQLGVPKAKSELYNAKQAVEFYTPGGMRIAKLGPILKRTGGRCLWCRKELGLNHADTSFEHLIPQSKGGGDDPDNLYAACRPCNSRRGNTSVPVWVRQLVDEGYQPQIRRVGIALQTLQNGRRKRQAKWARQWNQELIALVRDELDGRVPLD